MLLEFPPECNPLFKRIIQLFLIYQLELSDYYFRLWFHPNSIEIVCREKEWTNIEDIILSIPIVDYLEAVDKTIEFLAEANLSLDNPIETTIGTFRLVEVLNYRANLESVYCWECKLTSTQIIQLLS